MAGMTVCFGSGSFCPYPDTDWTFFLPESGSESAKINPVPIRKIRICEKRPKIVSASRNLLKSYFALSTESTLYFFGQVPLKPNQRTSFRPQ